MLPAQKYFEQGAKLLANKTFLKLKCAKNT